MMRSNDLINENFDGYHITAEHGSSIFSTTFIGESNFPTTGSQRVLIKLLSTAGSPIQQERQDILQKISALQRLRHPYILPILSVGIHNDSPYLITEYLETQSLDDSLQSRTAGQPVAIEEALLVLSQVGQALYYAHQQQVIHGHLRPQDVLFNEDGDALVTGFHRHILQISDNSYDTIPMELSMFKAPEQFSDDLSEKSDQYILACIAYDLFTGCRAFMIPSTNAPGTYYKTRSLIPPSRLNPDLPLYIEDAILKAMSREPEQRYLSIATFLNALRIPLPTGTRNLRQTDLLPEETLQRVSAVSFTPMPESLRGSARPDVAPDVPVVVTSDESRTYADILVRLFPDVAEAVEVVAPVTPATNSRVVDMSGRYIYQENTATLNMLSSPDIRDPLPLISNAGKEPGARFQRILIIMLCLVAVILLFTVLLVALNVSTPAKKAGISSSVTAVVGTATATHHGSVPGNGQSGTPTSSQGQGTNPAQGQGTFPLPPPIQTVTVRSAGFLQGVTAISASQAEFWFAPNGWTASNMVLYYTGAGQVQQNVQMSYNSTTGQWQYMMSGLSSAQTVIYWFTYQQSGTQYISGTYTYIVSAGTATPGAQSTPTPSSGCASSFSQGVNSFNAGQGLVQAQFWFSSCGWASSHLIVHYMSTSQVQHYKRMFYNSGAGQWQYTLGGLLPGETLTYWYTYMQNGTQYNSPAYSWTSPGRGFH